MTDSKDKKTSTLTLSGSKLSLKDIKRGQVPQSLSHGRVNKVKVEVRKKRRSLGTDQAAPETEVDNKATPVEPKIDEAALGGLTAGERDARLAALKQAAIDEEKRKEVEAERQKEEAERQKEEAKRAAEEAKKQAEEAKKQAEIEKKEREELKRKSQEQAANLAAETNSTKTVKPIKANERVASEAPKEKRKEEKKDDKKTKAKTPVDKRRSGKLTIAQALSGNESKERSLASVKRAREKAKRAAMGDSVEKEKVIREVVIPEVITVQELANRMAERAVDVIKSLMKMGMIVTASQNIDADTAELVVEEFGHKHKRVTEGDVENILLGDDDSDHDDLLESRAPVVTFMGHVDHGKTSLLDAIRSAKVADGEAGGITQHIGAYQVKTDGGDKITFLDTPGHEAFTEMRKRGADTTDVVVLVVAADDGIMAQTVEAINHAKAAGVTIIVAVNKIDKPDADPNRIRTELLSHEIIAEEMGGDVQVVDVSAKKGTNLDKLLEGILLQAEMLELKANPNRNAVGSVVEARMDKSRGAVSTVLVQKGTLRIGDIVVAGQTYGKVRAMVDDKGMNVKNAGPSTPVEILGLDGAPLAGSRVSVVESEKQAREITEYRVKRERDLKTVGEKHGSLDELFQQAAEGGIKELPIVIKSDVQGSAEAIVQSLQKIEADDISVKVLHTAVGGITASDVSLASASRAIVVGFNVRADGGAKELADKDGVDIRYYSIIYDLIDDVKAVMGGMLKPEIREKFLGTAEIREVFSVSKVGKVAGCYVTDGMIKRGAGVRLLRDNVVIHEGTLKTLRRFKDDVKEVATNFECGMAFEKYDDLKVGDVIEAFELIEERRQL